MFFRQGQTSSKTSNADNNASSIIKKMRLRLITDNNLGREIVMGFSNITTDDYDFGYDSKPTQTFDNDLTMQLNNQQMVLQGYADITSDKVVDLNFKADGNGTYAIKATEFVDFPASQEVYLRDNLTDTYHDLTSGLDYTFTSQAGTFADRFDVVFQSSEALSNEDFIQDQTIVYFDNKSNSLFVKELNQDAKTVLLYNALGQKVFSLGNTKSDALKNGIQISDLSTGLYIVSIKTETNIQIDKKIIIE